MSERSESTGSLPGNLGGRQIMADNDRRVFRLPPEVARTSIRVGLPIRADDSAEMFVSESATKLDPAEPASASPAGAQLAGKSSCATMQFQRTARSVLAVCLSPGDNPTMRIRCWQCVPMSVSLDSRISSGIYSKDRLIFPRISGCRTSQITFGNALPSVMVS